MRMLPLTVVLAALLFSLGCEDTPQIQAVKDKANEIASPNTSTASSSSSSGGSSAAATPSSSSSSSSGSSSSSSGGSTSSATSASTPTSSSSSGWRGRKKTYGLSGSSSGSISFQTRGIRPQSGRNRDGGWEYMFFTLRGSNFDRVIIYQVGGGRDAIRYLVSGPPKFGNNRATSDNLPGTHTWKVTYGGGRIKIQLDGRTLGDHPFNGRPSKAVIGGYDGSGRDFRGEWRNVSIR